MKKVFIRFVLFLFLITISSAQTWEEIQTPYFGNVSKLVVNSSGTLFAYCREFGIYSSNDNGENWSLIAGEFSHDYSAFGNTMTVAPNGYIYYGETTSYLSKDNGITWEWIEGPRATNISAVFNSKNELFVLNKGTYKNVYQYDISNKEWIKKNNGIAESIDKYEIAIYNDVLYLATKNGLYTSTDNAETWVASSFTSEIKQIAINSNGVIFAAKGSSLFRSEDNGSTWATINVGFTVEDIDIAKNNDLYTLKYGNLYKSVDNGDNWTKIKTNLPLTGKNLCLVDYNNKLLFPTSDGIFFSTDSGENWEQNSTGMRAYTISGILKNNDELFISGPYGTISSADSGTNWIEHTFSIGSFTLPLSGFTTALVANNGTILIGSQFNFFSSTDNGSSWNSIEAWLGNGARSIIQTNNLDLFVVNTYNQIHKSSDNGATWSQTGFANAVNDLVQTPNGQLLAAGGSKTFVSTDDGDTWNEVGTGIPATSIISHLLVSQSGKIFATLSSGDIYASTDNGNTWNISYDGNDLYMGQIVGTSSGIIYVASNEGIFRSADDGVSWENSLVYDKYENIIALFSGNDNYVYAAVRGRGLFYLYDEATEIKGSDNKIPIKYNLSQNYPNPFNPSTVINYSLPEVSNVRLIVYNTLGQEVITLVNQQQQLGNYQTKFDAVNLPSGIYLISINAIGLDSKKNFTKIKKAMLLK